MSRGKQLLQRLTLSCALGLAVAAASFAEPLVRSQQPFKPTPLPQTTAKANLQAGAAAAVAGKAVPVMVYLTDAPAAIDFSIALHNPAVSKARALENARAAAKAKVAALGPVQERVAAALTASPINAHEIYRLKKALNAISVLVDPAKLDAIRALPGVKRVHVQTLEVPTNITSVPFIGAPPAWGNALGLGISLTGKGVTIGIIDTGIDYQHPMFGGSGLLADYEANDRVHITPGQFPTAKVIGGTDLAGDLYNGGNMPEPDPNPTDCNDHGSHVAGTAAGFGVNNDGTTFTGPYGPGAPSPSALRIGPGVAPGASLVAIRVFGCGGSTGLVPQGIEFAMDPSGTGDFSDHLDVINMSLGAPFGGLDDSSAEASDSAALVGVAVAIAAGNDGDTFFIGGSPASASYAISAAAGVDPGVPGANLKVNAPASVAGGYAAAADGFGSGAPPPGGQTAGVVLVHSATGTADQGCDGNYTNAAAIKGSIALIMRGTCGFQAKVANAQAAGAIGAVVFNNVPGDPTLITMGATAPTPLITIPAVFISDNDGTALASASGVNATLAAASAADTLASFSSRGPRGFLTFPVALKPDITAPGLAIPSTQSGMTCRDPNRLGCIVSGPDGFLPGGQVLTISGTSMATPHIAGTMALLTQLHPDWSVEERKALAMNGAIHDLTVGANGSGLRYGLSRVGAGRVDIPSSVTNEVTAFNDDDGGLVSLSYDAAIVNQQTLIKNLRLVNHGPQSQTFDIGFDSLLAAPGVSFSLANPAQSSLTIPADSSVSIPVQMQADATQMDFSADPTLAPTQAAPAPLSALGNLPRASLTEAGTYLTLGQGGTTVARVPLYSIPRPASVMTGTSPISLGAGAVQLTGIGVCTGTVTNGQCAGNFPTTEASLVTPFELQGVNALNPNVPPFANIQYAGVAYDQQDGLLLFGISTWGPWSSQTDVAFNVYIDSQNNGTFDKVLFNSNPGEMSGQVFNDGGLAQDSFVTAFLDLNSNNVTVENFVNLLPANQVDSRLMVNRVMVLAASPKDLGLSGTAFKWMVISCPGFFPLCAQQIQFNYDAIAGPLSWDYAHPGLDFGGNFLAFDLNGATLPVNIDLGNFTNNRSLGALLLHTHNVDGAQAQVLPLEGGRSADLSVTSSITPATLKPVLGAPVTITVQVNNAGPNRARQVMVSDGLFGGLLYVSDDGNGAYDPNTGLWTVGQLAVNGTSTLHIKAVVAGTGEIQNTAQVAFSRPLDPNPLNDVSTLTVAAPRLADLDLTATGTQTGGTATFTVTVKNLGGDPSYNPRVRVMVGGGQVTATGTSVSQGTFDPTSGMWQLGSIGAGSTETLQFRVTAHHGSVGVHASVTASTADPNLINNQATATVTVH
jgi:uncharacterized repeat protein (TIGR01451 family)